MKSKLKQEEINQLFSIIERYQKVFDDITLIESEIENLNKRKDILVSELNNIREKEKVFTENIVKNYGKGKFNMETLEYELI